MATGQADMPSKSRDPQVSHGEDIGLIVFVEGRAGDSGE